MMRTLLVGFLAVIFVFSVSEHSFAGQGTKAEAKAIIEKAAAYIKANGKEKAYAEINNPKGKFTYKDLYIYAYDFNGVVLAHGANPKLIGKNLSDMQDADGIFVIKGLMEVARKGSGWFDYKWSNPQTKKIQDKSSYNLKIDDGLWMGCGVYK
jgi:methyl-accepting chemotaxis protein